jgi:hypothetical protein
LTNLVVYLRHVVPVLAPGGAFYTNYWINYGPTLTTALIGMATHPSSVFYRVLGSGFLTTVMPPHLFLPVIGVRWTIGLLPIVLIYGASANEQVRAFGVYYSTVLVPFLVIGASVGALTVARYFAPGARRVEIAAAAVVLLGALLAGFGFSLRPWRAENAAVPTAIARLADQPFVLVQSELFPHAGYDSRVQLLTPETLSSPRYEGAAILVAPAIGAYLIQRDDLDRLRKLPSVRSMPGGLLAVRRRAAR